jgi:hypothetical protein
MQQQQSMPSTSQQQFMQNPAADLEDLKKDQGFENNRVIFGDFSDSNHQRSHSALQAEISLSLPATIQMPQKPSPVFTVSPTMKDTMK